MLNSLKMSAIAAALCILPATTFAQNTYDVNSTSSPPTIDGIVSAGEWDDAAAEAGGWRILRDDAGPADTDNNRFRMMWDATNLYILYETDFGIYRDDNVRDVIRFGYNNINFYFDPDLDEEGNLGTETDPSRTPDGYQIAINMYLGSFTCASGCSVELNTNEFDAINAGPVGLSSFSGAYSDNTTGNNLGWLGMRGTQIGTVNGTSGGVMELAIPWTDFDAPGLDDNGLDPGLNLMGASPANGDQWNFNAGFIPPGSSPLPVWNWHTEPDPTEPLESFASQPHGLITFVADEVVVLGDVNMDGNVDFLDITPFIGLISNGEFKAEADINGDTSVDFLDIVPFIALLSA